MGDRNIWAIKEPEVMGQGEAGRGYELTQWGWKLWIADYWYYYAECDSACMIDP